MKALNESQKAAKRANCRHLSVIINNNKIIYECAFIAGNYNEPCSRVDWFNCPWNKRLDG